MKRLFRSKLVLALITLILLAGAVVVPLSGKIVHSHAHSSTPTRTSPPTFSDLHISGNQLVNTQGQPVLLHGVNRSGTEYMCVSGRGIFDGPSDAASVQAIQSWNANAVRVPLNEDCWLNINGVPSKYSGKNYRNAIVNYVNTLNQNNLYAIVDLHWSAPGTTMATGLEPMPDADHATNFWASVAATFKNNNKVIFDLFSEPYPARDQDTLGGWKCWKNGGTCKGIPFQTVGMQSLVTTVRNAGASNVIMLGGLEYANSLSHWLNYKPSDPLNNLSASWHIYPHGNLCNTTTCYNQEVAPVASQVPLIAGEVGASNDGSVCKMKATNIVLNWLDSHQASYLEWAWDTWGTSCGDLSLITNYNGTPKSPNGTNYKKHLLSL